MPKFVLWLQRFNKGFPDRMREMVATVEQTKANVLDQMNASKACLRASIDEPPLLRSQAQQKLLQMSQLLLELTQYTELQSTLSAPPFLCFHQMLLRLLLELCCLLPASDPGDAHPWQHRLVWVWGVFVLQYSAKAKQKEAKPHKSYLLVCFRIKFKMKWADGLL